MRVVWIRGAAGRPGPGLTLLATLLITGLLFGAAGSIAVPHSRIVAGGVTGCEGEEAERDVPALLAGWWWYWTAQSGDFAAAGEERHFTITVDTFSHQLRLYDGSELVEEYSVAVGKPRTPTPPGEWRVISKSMNWGGGFGTRWLGINVPWGIYGIHGTNKPYSISQSVSAGCIRMHNRDVEDLFSIVPVGTPVLITGPLPEVAGRDRIDGGSGKFMLVLQARLRQAGFDPGRVDGRFGTDTARAIEELHSYYRFPAADALSRDLQRLIYFPEAGR